MSPNLYNYKKIHVVGHNSNISNFHGAWYARILPLYKARCISFVIRRWFCKVVDALRMVDPTRIPEIRPYSCLYTLIYEVSRILEFHSADKSHLPRSLQRKFL
jgi:hypothetical protein